MELYYFESMEEALSSILKDDKTNQLIKRTLKEGEEINFHLHKKAREWVLIKSGTAVIKIVSRKKIRLYSIISGKRGVHAVYFPKGQPHYLEAYTTDLEYFVLRDRKDVSTRYKPGLKRKKKYKK